ncbi:MAG: hypothetical protein AABZ61_05425 [Bacteroidota bacterium]
MNKALTVARWEYLEKIKSKAFLISLFLMPIIMIGMGVLPTLLHLAPTRRAGFLASLTRLASFPAPLPGDSRSDINSPAANQITC